MKQPACKVCGPQVTAADGVCDHGYRVPRPPEHPAALTLEEMQQRAAKVGEAMSYRDCLACVNAGTKPKRGHRAVVVFDPTIQMPGCPTINGHRLGADFIASQVWFSGIVEALRSYELSREELLVACWWAGSFGSRRMRKAFGEWATVAGHHLWYRCINIAEPPRKEPEEKRP